LVVESRVTREMAPLALLRGEVRDEAGTVLAEARLKVFFEP
jgi:hypothetical protein